MAMCDMCGNETTLFRTNIEGTELNVCRDCGKYGEIIAPARKNIPKTTEETKTAQPVKKKTTEIIQVIADDYSSRIRNARERKGMKQEELAKALSEKESVIQKMETANFEPSLRLARKLENFLRIKLVLQHEEKHQASFKATGSALTIGDVLELKD